VNIPQGQDIVFRLPRICPEYLWTSFSLPL